MVASIMVAEVKGTTLSSSIFSSPIASFLPAVEELRFISLGFILLARRGAASPFLFPEGQSSQKERSPVIPPASASPSLLPPSSRFVPAPSRSPDYVEGSHGERQRRLLNIITNHQLKYLITAGQYGPPSGGGQDFKERKA